MGQSRLLDQLTFYGSYHHNKWNKLIHLVFVPTIAWSLCVKLAYTGQIAHLPQPIVELLPTWANGPWAMNGAFIFALLYTLIYMSLEPVAGVLWGLFMAVPIVMSSTIFQQQVPHAWQWALALNAFSWYMQIHPGHALCEGRKPALLDSLFQSLVVAPLFVWMEVLFWLGYRPQLAKQVEQRVRLNVAAFQRQQQQQQQSQRSKKAA